MPDPTDTETLAEVLIENRDRDYPASVYKFTPNRMAEAIIASDWFAARIEQARAGETALRERAEAAEAAVARVRALWGGGDHPPVFLSDRPNKIVRASARRDDLCATVTESFLRLDDVRAALDAAGDPT